MVYTTLETFPKGKSCNFCKTTTADKLTLGYIYKTGDIIVHYFCLLLASKGEQRGTDKQGLLGFLSKDIKKELQRGKNIKCVYCQKNGATVICSKSKCKRNFHLPCGLQKNSLHFFCNEFKSLCVNHRPKISVPATLKQKFVTKNQQCILCYNPVNIKDILNLIWSPCCKPNSLQHKKCVQQMAYTAGYYFKCPFCANIKKFNKCMRELGIYIPEQEAVWEREPRAFSDLNVPLKCGKKTCSCPKGASFSRNSTKWLLKNCTLCGGNARHLACSEIWKPGSKYSIDWQCPDCTMPTERNNSPDANRRNNSIDYSDTSSYDSNITASEDLDNKSDNQNAGPRIKIGINSLEEKERIVPYLGIGINNTASPTFNRNNLLLVNEDNLNDAMKNVSNVDEIIINNKRCMVLLNKLDIDAGHGPTEIAEDLIQKNEQALSKVFKDASEDIGYKTIDEDENELQNNMVLNGNNNALCMQRKSPNNHEMFSYNRILLEHSYCRVDINNQDDHLNPSTQLDDGAAIIPELNSFKIERDDKIKSLTEIENKVHITANATFNIDMIIPDNKKNYNEDNDNNTKKLLLCSGNRKFKTLSIMEEKNNLREILLEQEYEYKNILKLLNNVNTVFDDEKPREIVKITCTKQMKQIHHQIFKKPYMKGIKDLLLPSPYQSAWNTVDQNVIIKRKFHEEIQSFLKGNKCKIFSDRSGIKYIDVLKMLISDQMPVDIYKSNHSEINSLLLEVCDLLQSCNNKNNLEKCSIIIVSNPCLGSDNEDKLLVSLKLVMGNINSNNLIICRVPSNQKCTGLQTRMLISYNKKLICYSEKLGFKLWDLKKIFV